MALTFATATLAVMANTGLLSVTPDRRDVGNLSPNDLVVPSTAAGSSGTVVRYEDVYVDSTKEPAPVAPTVLPKTKLSKKVASASTGPTRDSDKDNDDD